MKKIAFILKFFQKEKFHGGGEKLFYMLITNLLKDGYSVDIYCAKTDVIEHEGIGKIVKIDAPYHHLKPTVLENFYNEAKKQIEKENYDYVISENITPPVDITFLQGHSMLHRQKSVKTPFEAIFYPFRKVKRERIKYQQKWMKEGYRKIFVPSGKVKEDIINNFGVNPNKISIIYPGVDTEEVIFDKEKNIKNKKFVFGMSAPGFEKKGGYIFLNALNILKNKGFDVEAKIIYPKFKTNFFVKAFLKISRLDKTVEFLGFQSDMNDFYNSIDCAVMPSKEDSFGMVALEAMARSKPVIVSSNAGASEIIQNGKNGFIFDMKDSEKNLAEKMIFVLNNKKDLESIADYAFETSRKYSWEKVYKDFASHLP